MDSYVAPTAGITTTAAMSSMPLPRSTSSIGWPAVPEGSPSSLDRSTGFAPSTA